jgi:CBS domain-containing protein
MGVVSTAVGFAAGYVLGATKGFRPVRNMSERAKGALVERMPGRSGSTAPRSGSTLDVRDIREVMTALPQTLDLTATIKDAARVMEGNDIGVVVVVDGATGRVAGMLTDRDVTIRAVAEGRDPSTTTVGQVYSSEIATLAPTDNVQDAIRLMRERGVRRLPVVQDGRPIGVVSLGDISVEADPGSVLADISAASPNR